MERYLKILGVIVILIGCYAGVRYWSVLIHYACAVPAEDCPPPFYAAGQLGYYVTGGDLVPVWGIQNLPVPPADRL